MGEVLSVEKEERPEGHEPGLLLVTPVGLGEGLELHVLGAGRGEGCCVQARVTGAAEVFVAFSVFKEACVRPWVHRD